MVRLSDLPDYEAEHLLAKNGEPLGPLPWVQEGRALAERRIVLITTAGIHRAGETPFEGNDASYRVIPGDLDGIDLAMSHASVNFDRTGFFEDVNVVFPIDRFRERERNGSIASLASAHYSFMGAGLEPRAYERSVRGLAAVLSRDGVDTAFLTPV